MSKTEKRRRMITRIKDAAVAQVRRELRAKFWLVQFYGKQTEWSDIGSYAITQLSAYIEPATIKNFLARQNHQDGRGPSWDVCVRATTPEKAAAKASAILRCMTTIRRHASQREMVMIAAN